MCPLSAPLRLKIAEITDKHLTGKALEEAIAKAMDSDATLEQASKKQTK